MCLISFNNGRLGNIFGGPKKKCYYKISIRISLRACYMLWFFSMLRSGCACYFPLCLKQERDTTLLINL